MSEHVLIERRGHVMEITLNKPKVNAIDHEMSKAVADAFVAFDTDDDLRVAILTASGDRIFSAGWDLKALDRGDAKLDEWWDDGDYGYGGFAGLTENWTMNKPVIAGSVASSPGTSTRRSSFGKWLSMSSRATATAAGAIAPSTITYPSRYRFRFSSFVRSRFMS